MQCTLQKGIRDILDLKQKGQITLSNNATSVLHETILYLSLKKRKILKIQKENAFVWIRAPAAILPVA
jgi:hypothetical protein